jgi:hypothetical protein
MAEYLLDNTFFNHFCFLLQQGYKATPLLPFVFVRKYMIHGMSWRMTNAAHLETVRMPLRILRLSPQTTCSTKFINHGDTKIRLREIHKIIQ